MTGETVPTGGWYVGRRDGASPWEGGPYSWDQLVGFAGDGRLRPTDHVWHAPMPEWVLAATIPGLKLLPVVEVPSAPAPAYAAPLPAPAAAPAAASAAAGAPAPAAPAPKRATPRLLLPTAIGLAVLLIVGLGAVALLRGGSAAGADLGAAKATVPDSASLVKTASWGEVPANQIVLMMADGAQRSDAEAAAKHIGGSLVGEVAFAGVYQVEFPGTTEAHLAAALAGAGSAAKVEAAFPNQAARPDTEIWGVRVDPYNDPVYEGDAGAGYRAIGVSKAWSYIRGAGVDLNPVKVGMIDDGLYLPGGRGENEFGDGPVKIEYPDPNAAAATTPEIYKDGTVNPAGNHGTAVATMIAANPDNGGAAGVAGPLGDKLTLSVIDGYAGQYGTRVSSPDPSDPTKRVGGDGKTYLVGDLVALTKQVANHATVINCSWGISDATTSAVACYRRFFAKMAKEHPDVLFVCSGGNGGTVMDGSKRVPSGLNLPNMVTVGWLNNDGTTAKSADRASDNYEITLGAPGTDAVVGIDAGGGGVVQAGGSSVSAPLVTAAAAMLKSLNPKLMAGDIKQILSDTARPGVADASGDANASSHPIGKEMGGRILAVDEAVLKVINDLRKAKGLTVLTGEALEKLGVVDAVAVSGDPGEYAVRGIVAATGEKGTDLKIAVTGENSAVGGNSSQPVAGAGEARWSVTLLKDEGTIKVTRTDSGAASIITVEPSALAGTWEYADVWALDGAKPEPTGITLTMTIVKTGDGYRVTKGFTVPSTVTLDGAKVTITLHSKGHPDGFRGILKGDTITGEQIVNSAGWIPWTAKRRK